MTPRTTSLLTDPQPHSHIVYPCADENLIGEAVVTFASSGLRQGDAVILVTTEPRRVLLERRLTAEGFNVRSLQSGGQLAFVDAGELLAALMVDGVPDATRFKNAVTRIISAAAFDDWGQQRKVRIFGEMVSLLYGANQIPEAERLEEFWNQLVQSHRVSLFCAYSLALGSATHLPQSLIDCHSHSLSSPEFTD